MRVALCTISSANYFALGKTLLNSVASIHPELDRFYLLVDKPNGSIVAEDGFSMIHLDQLGIENLEQMEFAYDVVELNTAVKPFLLSHLLHMGYQKVVYLDPDIVVYNRLDDALKALDTHSIVLTPHSVHPAEPATSFLSRIEHEKNMSTTGIFNLGFIGISDRPETHEFLSWWQNRCRYLCFVDPTAGIFVDQKWAELAIAYWKDVFILRDPGYNVSVWNLHGRSVVNSMVNGSSRLVFYHFSSIDIHDASILSKNERNVRTDHDPELRELFDKYRNAVIANGHDRYSAIPYGFGSYSDGKNIDLLERRLFSMVADQIQNPFGFGRKEFYRLLGRCSTPSAAGEKGFAFAVFAAGARWVFKLIGPRRYRALAMLLGKSAQLRAHLFLLR